MVDREALQTSSSTSRIESYLIAAVALISLALPVLITILAPNQPAWDPIKSLLLGIGVATITYHLLGGIADAAFNTPIIKLGGAGALLIATAWLSHAWYEDAKTQQSRINDSIAIASKANASTISALNEQVTELQIKVRQQKMLITGGTGSNTVEEIATRVENAEPGDSLADRIVSIQRTKRGPWRERLDPKTVSISFAGIENIRSKERDGTTLAYTACPGLDLTTTTVFALDEQQGAASGETVEAVYAGPMPTNYCRGEDANRVQLSCASARRLVPDLIKGCTDSADIGWTDPKKDNHRYSGVAESKAGSDR